jgi:hypothetical protein
MAATTRSRTARKTTAAKAAPVPEPEELEEELEELADDEEFEEIEDAPAQAAPAGRKTRSAGADITFGVAHLAEYLTNKLKKPVSTRELRTLIRRMARETERAGGPRVNREIVAGNRTRYDWPNGLKDQEVKNIIAAYEGGESEAAKKEALEKLKSDSAAKRAAKAPTTPAKATAKKAAKPKPVAEDDEDEELDFDDED